MPRKVVTRVSKRLSSTVKVIMRLASGSGIFGTGLINDYSTPFRELVCCFALAESHLRVCEIGSSASGVLGALEAG
jgi:hypothetical protein